MLRALVLALHYYTTGLMGQTHRRIGFINMLTTGTRCAVSIRANIRRININLNIVINLRRHIDRRERCMTAITRIKWRLAHQTMHTNLSTQPTKGIFTANLHRGTFNTSHITGRAFHQLRFKAFIVSPAQIHAQQHLSPILSLSATRARLNIQISVIWVHLATKHTAKFQLR